MFLDEISHKNMWHHLKDENFEKQLPYFWFEAEHVKNPLKSEKNIFSSECVTLTGNWGKYVFQLDDGDRRGHSHKEIV